MTDKKLKLGTFMPYTLSITSNMVSDLIARHYRDRYALNIPEWRLMAVLGERDEATQSALVEATLMDKVTVNRATKRLADRHLIERVPHARDKRSHHLRLTGAGRELYGQIMPAALAIEKKLLAALSIEECETLDALLAKLRAAAQETEPPSS